VQIYIDGTLVMQMTSGPYNYKWNTNNIVGGMHTITAKAYDITGNSAVASETVHTSQKK
jgi:Big-like domain-containing protein